MGQGTSSLLQLAAIKLLKHQRLIRPLFAEIVPPMILTVLHLAQLVPAVREDQSIGDDILLRTDGQPITDSERIPMDSLQRPPDIDDQDPTVQQLLAPLRVGDLCFEMAQCACDGEVRMDAVRWGAVVG